MTRKLAEPPIPWDERNVVLVMAQVDFTTTHRNFEDWKREISTSVGADLATEPLEVQEQITDDVVRGLTIHFHPSSREPTRIQWILQQGLIPDKISPSANRLSGLLRGTEGALATVAGFLQRQRVEAEIECTYLVNSRRWKARVSRPKDPKIGSLQLVVDSVAYRPARTTGRLRSFTFDYLPDDSDPFVKAEMKAEVDLGPRTFTSTDTLIWQEVVKVLERRK